MTEPAIGDVFGEMIRDAYAVRTGVGPRPLAGGRVPRPVIEVIERDDGLINGAPADHYLGEPDEWQPHDHRALRLCRGQVLDIGVGAGRTAVELQRRGMAVTGLGRRPPACGRGPIPVRTAYASLIISPKASPIVGCSMVITLEE